MKNLCDNKFFSLVIIISLIAASLFSYGYIMSSMDHICTDKICQACAQITLWIGSLRLIGSAIVWLSIIINFLNAIFSFNLQQKCFKNQINNLVWLKVKLNN